MYIYICNETKQIPTKKIFFMYRKFNFICILNLGVRSVVVSNTGCHQVWTIYLIFVDGPGNSLTLSPPIKNLTLVVEAGESIPKITCKADCVPSCEFQWTQYIRKGQIHRSSNAVLDLGNATSSKVGYYICEAYNYVGPDKHTGSLKFQIYVRCKYTNVCPKSVSNILRIYVNILHYI